MSKYKPGDKFILELTGTDEIAGREVYLVKGCTGGFSENFLDNLEKAKDVQIVRGEWKIKLGSLILYYKCSECGYVNLGQTKYCPNCGADMRKKVDK